MTIPSYLLTPSPTLSLPGPPILSEKQRADVDALVAHFEAAGFELPGSEGSATQARLSERECMFLVREIAHIGTKGDVPATTKRLEECIVWRRTNKLDNVETMAQECEAESRTGKNIALGFSQAGQPIIYFFPNRNTTPLEQRRTIHAIFMLERAGDLMCDGVTNTCVIFNFAGKRQGPPSSVANARAMIHNLSAYYPERLGVSYLQSVHWVIRGFVSLLWPLVDANTRAKVRFEEGAQAVKAGVLDPKALLKECGGELDMPYNHDAYWPALIATCLARRADQLERWRALPGSRVGRDETSFKVRPIADDCALQRHALEEAPVAGNGDSVSGAHAGDAGGTVWTETSV
ncbi:Phosphatidylinositol transfer protein (PITP) [Cryptotrichosporon argae]